MKMGSWKWNVYLQWQNSAEAIQWGRAKTSIIGFCGFLEVSDWPLCKTGGRWAFDSIQQGSFYFLRRTTGTKRCLPTLCGCICNLGFIYTAGWQVKLLSPKDLVRLEEHPPPHPCLWGSYVLIYAAASFDCPLSYKPGYALCIFHSSNGTQICHLWVPADPSKLR